MHKFCIGSFDHMALLLNDRKRCCCHLNQSVRCYGKYFHACTCVRVCICLFPLFVMQYITNTTLSAVLFDDHFHSSDAHPNQRLRSYLEIECISLAVRFLRHLTVANNKDATDFDQRHLNKWPIIEIRRLTRMCSMSALQEVTPFDLNPL